MIGLAPFLEGSRINSFMNNGFNNGQILFCRYPEGEFAMCVFQEGIDRKSFRTTHYTVFNSQGECKYGSNGEARYYFENTLQDEQWRPATTKEIQDYGYSHLFQPIVEFPPPEVNITMEQIKIKRSLLEEALGQLKKSQHYRYDDSTQNVINTIETVLKEAPVRGCSTCKHERVSQYVYPCYGCLGHSDYPNYQS